MPHIRTPIAVGVLQIPNIWRARDEHAAFPRQDAIGKRETLGKSGALFELPVAIGILQQRNPAKFRTSLPSPGRNGYPGLSTTSIRPFVSKHIATGSRSCGSAAAISMRAPFRSGTTSTPAPRTAALRRPTRQSQAKESKRKDNA